MLYFPWRLHFILRSFQCLYHWLCNEAEIRTVLKSAIVKEKQQKRSVRSQKINNRLTSVDTLGKVSLSLLINAASV